VASRRLIDEVRSEHARRRRELDHAAEVPLSQSLAEGVPDADDSLTLLFLCCHPSLSGPSQIALTLRAAGGLTTAQIAAAFLVPEATMAQRISRAKQTIKASGARFAMPEPAERDSRLHIVLHVLYLIFNEGYAATAGPDLTAPQLSAEAIRLTRWLHRLLPADGEVTGLLALMLLTDARRAARAAPDGRLVPLDEQDRAVWDRDRIAEGVALISETLPKGRVGPYQVQAAIAAVHDEAETMDATDWPQILGLYDLLERIAPSPLVTLNRAVAVAMVAGPAAGLDALSPLDSDPRLATYHRLLATRAHLLEMSGDAAAAAASYREAARRTTSLPERRYLTGRAMRLAGK
jgi:predicted RNA polymerase sigma factor